MITKHIAFWLLLTLHLFSKALHAQSTYKSKEGILSATAVYFDEPLTAHGKEVEVSLDFETSAIMLAFNLSTLHTGIDSLDQKLKKLTEPFVFMGTLNLGQVTTTTHSPRSFQLNGTLETPQNQKVEIKGVGKLEHIDGGEDLACELALYFDADAGDLGLYSARKSPEEQHLVKVQIFETILRKTY